MLYTIGIANCLVSAEWERYACMMFFRRARRVATVACVCAICIFSVTAQQQQTPPPQQPPQTTPPVQPPTTPPAQPATPPAQRPTNPFENVNRQENTPTTTPGTPQVQRPQMETPKQAEQPKGSETGQIIEGIEFRGARRVPQDTLQAAHHVQGRRLSTTKKPCAATS